VGRGRVAALEVSRRAMSDVGSYGKFERTPATDCNEAFSVRYPASVDMKNLSIS
jgi:hypothetical protein